MIDPNNLFFEGVRIYFERIQRFSYIEEAVAWLMLFAAVTSLVKYVVTERRQYSAKKLINKIFDSKHYDS